MNLDNSHSDTLNIYIMCLSVLVEKKENLDCSVLRQKSPFFSYLPYCTIIIKTHGYMKCKIIVMVGKSIYTKSSLAD